MKQNTQQNKEIKSQLNFREEKRIRRRRKKMLKKIQSFFEEIWMYILTMAGVLLSKYMPEVRAIIQNGSDKNIDFNVPYRAEIVAAFIMALLVVYMMEKDGDEEGKKRNFKRRALTHFANGVLWHTIIGG